MISPFETIDLIVHIAPDTFSGYQVVRVLQKESPQVSYIKKGDSIVQEHDSEFRTIENVSEVKLLSDPPQGTGEHYIRYKGKRLSEGKALVWLDPMKT